MKKHEKYLDKKYSAWNLDEFISIKKLGNGMFGSVYLVKHKRGNYIIFYYNKL